MVQLLKQKLLLLFVFSVLTLQDVLGQGPTMCPSFPGATVGEDTSAGGNTDWPVANAPVSVAMTNIGIINCWGVLTSWTFRKEAGYCGNTLFHVWRKTVGNNYDIIGTNDFSTFCLPAAQDEQTYDVPEHQRIPVQPGDVIGFTMSAGGGPPAGLMIRSKNGGSSIHYKSNPACSTTPGDICGLTPGTDHDFYVKAAIQEAPPPTLDNLPTTVDIWEDEAVGSYVYQVDASHEINAVPLPGVVKPTPVTLTLSMGASMAGIFRLSGNTPGSDVETDMVFDYETQTTYVVPLNVECMQITASSTLIVNILDKNEAHTITNLPDTLFIPATTTSQDDPLFQVTFTDPDATNDVKFYIKRAVPNPAVATTLTPPFYIDEATGMVRASRDLVDWTGPTRYFVTVSAADDMHVVNDVLKITIQNLRTAPVFTNVPIAVWLPEDAPGGSSVFQASAGGPVPAESVFSIESVLPSASYYSFDINPVTGEIHLSASPNLDYVVANKYTLTLGVRDSFLTGVNQVLTIDVIWRNEDPYFDPADYTVSIPEKCGTNAVACAGAIPVPVVGLTLVPKDRDVDNAVPPAPLTPAYPYPLPTPDTLTCTVQPGFGSGFFTPVGCTGLQVTGVIDLDANPQYADIYLTMRVVDGHGGSALGTVHVTVYDINDNAPIFSPNAYNTSIYENTPGGTSVITVTATDADSGPDGEILYTIQNLPDGLGSQYFHVHPTTGVISVQQPVDYEVYPLISFDVVATDKGTVPGPLSDIARVDVHILDVNDNPPYWWCNERSSYEPYDLSAPCFYNTELRADILVGYEHLQIQARDIDTISPVPTYFLLEPNNYFILQTLDGVVAVKNELTAYTQYIMYCYAQDRGSPDLWSRILYVRIDTFDPNRQLIDITLEVPMNLFNQTSVQMGFIRALENVTRPWFPKMESVRLDKDKTVVSVYWLMDTNTYDEHNLAQPKHFVDRDPLLNKLRKDIFGTPKDLILGPTFTPYGPILVMPSYPIWWIDTVAGICVIALLCLLFVGLVVGIILGICKKYQVLCFQKKPPARAWKPPVKEPEPEPVREPVRQRNKPPTRKASVDTIHSIIFDPNRDKMF